MTSKKTYLDHYKALCTPLLDDDEGINAAKARQIVLCKTLGTCDPALLLKDDGNVLDLRWLCKSTMPIVQNRHLVWKISLDKFVDKMMKKEPTLRPLRRSTSRNRLTSIFARKHKDVSSLRKSLMNNSHYRPIAIHFFKWDGSCRNADEIWEAMMKYPIKHGRMLTLVKVMIGGFSVLGIVSTAFVTYLLGRAFFIARQNLRSMTPWTFQTFNDAHPDVWTFQTFDDVDAPAAHHNPPTVTNVPINQDALEDIQSYQTQFPVPPRLVPPDTRRRALLTRLSELCDVMTDPISLETFNELGYAELRTIVNLLDDGVMESMPRGGTVRGRCYVAQGLFRWMQTSPTQPDRTPLTPLHMSHIRSMYKTYLSLKDNLDETESRELRSLL